MLKEVKDLAKRIRQRGQLSQDHPSASVVPKNNFIDIKVHPVDLQKSLLISVIIPVYNGERFIRETIESVLNQTFQDFEIIIINDGSTDSTLTIVSSFSDPRIKVFTYPNRGLSTSRNRGIHLASGKYLAFLDADDLWTSGKLKAQVNALEENPHAALVYSWTDQADESGQFLEHGAHWDLSGDVFEKLLQRNFLDCGSNPLVRASVFEELGGFDESLPSAEDWDMWLRIALQHPMIAIPKVQVLYRRHSLGKSSDILKLVTSVVRVLEKAFASAPSSLQHLKGEVLFRHYLGAVIATILKEAPGRTRGVKAAKLLMKCIKCRPSIIREKPDLVARLLVKMIIIIIFPHRAALVLISALSDLKRKQEQKAVRASKE